MADATEKFEEELRKLTESAGKQSAAQDDVIKTLLVLKKLEKEEAEQLKKLQTAKEKELEILRQKADREQNILIGLSGLSSALKQSLLSFTSVTSSVYNTDKAFTAVIPVLDTMATVAKTTISAFGKMASGMSFLGFSTGRLSEGMAELANSGIDVLTSVLKFQLETAQKVADNFVVLSKSGITFGGSIDRMAKGAADAGLTIDMFTKFMSTNVESLAQMSGGIQNSGAQIASLGREIGQTNRRLLLSYGSYDELNNAIVEYTDLQRRVGIDELRDRESLKKGATDYLVQQKELTALTGKSADQLKKEQEERRKDSAYQLALNKMSAEERLNAEYALTQISAKFGPEAAQYAKELISTGGQVFSKTGIAFEAMAGPITDTIKTSVLNLNQTTDAFKQNTNTVIAGDAARNAAFAKNSDQLLFAQMTQAGYGNDIVKTLSNLAGAVLAAEVSATNAVKNRQALEDENAKGIGAASQNYVNAVETLITQQQKIDGIVIGNMNKMAELVQGLYAVNTKFINATDGMSEAINGLMSGTWKDFKSGMDKFSKSMLSMFGIDTNMNASTVTIHTPSVTVATEARVAAESSAATATTRAISTDNVNDRREAWRLQREAEIARATEETARRNAARASMVAPLDPRTGMPVQPTASDAGQNLPMRASGGITSGPTIVGEDGAEAVIPLKGGSIPLKIDFGPLSMAMEKQMSISERMLDEIRDSKDIQKQILNASY